MGWRHSKEANSSSLFKAICDKRIMMAATTALLKNKKDKTLTNEQQHEIQQYYNEHTDIPLGVTAAIYFRYMKELLISKGRGKVSEKAIKSALKLYAINSTQQILTNREADKLSDFIKSCRTNDLHLEYQLLKKQLSIEILLFANW